LEGVKVPSEQKAEPREISGEYTPSFHDLKKALNLHWNRTTSGGSSIVSLLVVYIFGLLAFVAWMWLIEPVGQTIWIPFALGVGAGGSACAIYNTARLIGQRGRLIKQYWQNHLSGKRIRFQTKPDGLSIFFDDHEEFLAWESIHAYRDADEGISFIYFGLDTFTFAPNRAFASDEDRKLFGDLVSSHILRRNAAGIPFRGFEVIQRAKE
jgi:hypothetical protein